MKKHTIEAEKEILSILLNDRKAQDHIFSYLNVEDFEDNKNAELFRIINNIYLSGTPISVIMVSERVDHEGLSSKVKDSLILDIFSSYTTSANIDQLIKIVIKESTKRKLENYWKEVKDNLDSPKLEIKALLFQLEKKLLDISKSGQVADFKNMKEVTESTYKKIVQLANMENKLTGTTSGFKSIDDVTNGFQPGDLIILAARPGMGKTAFCLNILSNAAKECGENEVVVMFSIEMHSEQLLMRMISSESQISQTDIRMGKIGNRWQVLHHVIGEIQKLNIMIDDSSNQTILEIYGKLRKISTNKKIKLVVIDYLQLLKTDDKIKSKGDNRQQEVAQISRMLKSFAREIETPIIAIAQLSRKIEERRGATGRPLLSDLRESGAIEQDADLVTFLYREEKPQDPNSPQQVMSEVDSRKIEYIISKHRNGSTADIPLIFDKSTGKFIEYND